MASWKSVSGSGRGTDGGRGSRGRLPGGSVLEEHLLVSWACCGSSTGLLKVWLFPPHDAERTSSPFQSLHSRRHTLFTKVGRGDAQILLRSFEDLQTIAPTSAAKM